VGKRAAIAEAGRPIRKTLRPCVEESKNWDTTENLYIEGDNLNVLKLLQESYLGKVKMIYIDPPYNTGNDFVYCDNFTRDKDEYDEEAGVYDEDGDRLFRNTESNGRFHSDWCNMMYPRLVLARNLLRDDGVIFISIDDNEVDNLQKLANEVFGEVNFVAQFPWRKRTAKSDVPFGVSQDYEWIVCYAKSNSFIAGIESSSRKYYESLDFPNRPWRVHNMLTQRSAAERPNSDFTIVNPKNGAVYPVNQNAVWRVTKDSFKQFYNDGRIVFPGDYDFLNISKPVLRYFKDDDAKNDGDMFGFSSISTNLPKYIGMTQDGTKDINQLFGKKVFGFPKPVALLKYLIKMSTIVIDNDAIILDFFSGSATTAHAIMQLNAEDGGKRKFIMIQLPEPCPEGSEAAKAGYKNICEIGKERIRRAGEKIVSSLQLSVDSNEEMKRYGCIKLSRSDCLAKSDGPDGNNLFTGAEITQRGNVRSVGSDEASGCFNSLEHSGGPGKKHEQGIRSVSGDCTGVEGGIGASIVDLHQGGIPCRFGHFGSDRIDTGNRQNAECPHYKTENCPLKTDHCRLDIGFRVLKLDDTNMKDVYYAAGEYTQDLLAGMEDNIKDDRTDMDLLYACLLDWGLPLSMPHTQEKIGGFTVHTYNDGDLIACFDKHISDAVVKEIAKRQPLRAVFRDSSFASSPEKINVEEIFKLLAPNTSVRVI
jgi:adenine specific DNA methylase Mod